MSFIGNTAGRGFEAGWFLADNEDCTRISYTIAANHAQAVTLANGTKIVPAGAVIPANGSTAVGILYEDVDVTLGAAAGSIVTRGTIYGDRLPAALDSDAASALTEIKVIASTPAIRRPNFSVKALTALTVNSVAGTAAGDTKITVSGYTKKADEGYVYKVATGTAPAVRNGQILGEGWTAWDGTSDITAATDKKITVAVVDSIGMAVAAGNATVTAKA